VTTPASPAHLVDPDDARATPTGVSELDRVLGGGLVPGSAVLLAGEPGIGKSTLLLQVAAAVAEQHPTLYVSGEETVEQVRRRAARLGLARPQLLLAAESDLGATLAQVEAAAPRLLVLDSVQTITSERVDGSSGGVAQVREVAGALVALAKRTGVSVILVGHVTKDGSVAGPRTLEHMVDVVLQLEGEPQSRLRLLRGLKNRYGPSDEVGCFEMGDAGMRPVPDPTGLFVSRHPVPVPGSCLTVTLQGRRALPSELQALVLPDGQGRRTTVGLDSARVAMLLAVLERVTRAPLRTAEVYVTTVGGTRLVDPGVDLAIALAAHAAVRDIPVPADLVAIGEVGLAGELRPVVGLVPRLAEAARMGLRRAVVPPGLERVPDGLDVREAPTLAAALALVWGEEVGSRRLRPAP
jgi:DNA repair protein RadA/Sms